MLKPENHQTYLFEAYTQKAAGNGLMLRPICNPAGHRFGGGASLKSWKMPKGGLRRSAVQNHNNVNLQRSSCATAFSEHRRGGRLALRPSRSQHWPVILPHSDSGRQVVCPGAAARVGGPGAIRSTAKPAARHGTGGSQRFAGACRGRAAIGGPCGGHCGPGGPRRVDGLRWRASVR
jgi:hypothetical protein